MKDQFIKEVMEAASRWVESKGTALTVQEMDQAMFEASRAIAIWEPGENIESAIARSRR